MQLTYLQIAYLISSILFILSLRGLSSQESAKQGNFFGIVGMGIALAATLLNFHVNQYETLLLTLSLGSLIGWVMAKRVQMTAMPELVALLHSFVGLAAVFVGFASDRVMGSEAHPATGLYASAVAIDIFIGALSIFSGPFAVMPVVKPAAKPAPEPMLCSLSRVSSCSDA